MKDIYRITVSQLKNSFLLSDEQESVLVEKGLLEQAEEAAIRAVSAFGGKHFSGKYDPLYGNMYVNYLYWLGRFCYECGNEDVATIVYNLNKMLHSVDLFYEIELPANWSCEHPLGSIMGRAQYGDRFFFYQNCMVGTNVHDGTIYYPVIGDDCIMFPYSKIVGDCHIGNNVWLSANSFALNETIPDDSVVFGQSPNIIIRRR